MKMGVLQKVSRRFEAVLGWVVAAFLLVTLTTGCAGLVGYEKVEKSQPAVPGAFTVVTAACPAGKKILGGGFHGIGDDKLRVTQQFPQENTDAQGNTVHSWQVGVVNQGAFPRQVSAYALCAR